VKKYRFYSQFGAILPGIQLNNQSITTTNHPQRKKIKKICEMAGRRPVISQIFLFLNPKTLNDWIYNANDVANTRIRNKTKNT